MKPCYTSIALLLLALLFAIPASAQKMTVESMSPAGSDMTATLDENLHQDLNGHYGGLVKVFLAAPNVQFLGPSVLEAKAVAISEYWVFMAKDAFKLQVAVPGYLPLDINFRNYGIEGIEPRRTYTLTILLPYAGNVVSNSTNTELGDASNSDKEVFTVNGVSFTMVRVEGGTFTMGATEEQGIDSESDEKPAHKVTLSTFSIGETEVTQALWQAVMGSNPSYYKDNPQNPVEVVSWDDCQEFIKKLNSLMGMSFRLPTEAEWEYAARGGNKSKHYKYSGSNIVGDVAWLWENSGNKPLSGEWSSDKVISNNCKPHPVKGKFPNELGLYDMAGNVWEWCEDWYGNDYYASSPTFNPKGPSIGSHRVSRGGSWMNDAKPCRVSVHGGSPPITRNFGLGFRIAL